MNHLMSALVAFAFLALACAGTTLGAEGEVQLDVPPWLVVGTETPLTVTLDPDRAPSPRGPIEVSWESEEGLVSPGNATVTLSDDHITFPVRPTSVGSDVLLVRVEARGVNMTALSDIVVVPDLILEARLGDLRWVGPGERIHVPWRDRPPLDLRVTNRGAATVQGTLVVGPVEMALDLQPNGTVIHLVDGPCCAGFELASFDGAGEVVSWGVAAERPWAPRFDATNDADALHGVGRGEVHGTPEGVRVSLQAWGVLESSRTELILRWRPNGPPGDCPAGSHVQDLMLQPQRPTQVSIDIAWPCPFAPKVDAHLHAPWTRDRGNGVFLIPFHWDEGPARYPPPGPGSDLYEEARTSGVDHLWPTGRDARGTAYPAEWYSDGPHDPNGELAIWRSVQGGYVRTGEVSLDGSWQPFLASLLPLGLWAGGRMLFTERRLRP